MWADELKLAIAEAAEHLSLYQLTIEEGTPFSAACRGQTQDPDEATAGCMSTRMFARNMVCRPTRFPNHARSGASANTMVIGAARYAGIGPAAHGRLDIDGTDMRSPPKKRPEAC